MRSALLALWISAAATGVMASEPTPPVAAAETTPVVTTVAIAGPLAAVTDGPVAFANPAPMAVAAAATATPSIDTRPTLTAALSTPSLPGAMNARSAGTPALIAPTPESGDGDHSVAAGLLLMAAVVVLRRRSANSVL